MIFEDIHWIDPRAWKRLVVAVDRIESVGVLLIITYRPEFEPPWIGRPHVTALTLNRFGAARNCRPSSTESQATSRCRANIRQDIIERTDGIPLFVEEMTKAVLEAEGKGDAQRTAAVCSVPQRWRCLRACTLR